MSAAIATYRVNYSDYMADITGNPKTTNKSANNGISQLSSHFSSRQNQPVQQTGAMPHYGGGAEKCARCSKNVYLAEKKAGAGRSYHSSCFSCETCNRKLDATTLSEHKGEIYCKTCYTRQFGVHGLVSGVTMSTEHPVRENRHSRRSSYGSDLDAPVITHTQPRPRAHSNDNMLRGEHSAIQSDELPKMFPWRNDVIPAHEHQIPPTKTNKVSNGLDDFLNKDYTRPASQIGFEKIIESAAVNNNNNNRESAYMAEGDRQKYMYEGDQMSYTNGTSAIIDMPIISPVKRFDSHIERTEMPTVPTKHDQRSRSPSPTSNDIHRRQDSREQHHTDISDNFSRLTINEKHHDNITTNAIASENPLFKPTYNHSPSHENKQRTSNTDREQNHSRDSSPSATANSNRSPSPTSGYGSSSVHGEGLLRDSSSPPSAFVPQHDYLNTRSSNTKVVDRHSPASPERNERTSPSSALNDFVTKTNTISSPTVGGKYSTLAALIKPHRPLSQLNNPTDDDDQFDN
ncbi:unnamed protein product [Adineta steineri]|uniref:LIM zinc-binding domain-containing protein n=1 Tax=Adineta steineri TaxID=433720 RepID=A0A819MIB4_9BILA|nr:unnamed protein product [Adineta steineri]